MPLGPPPCTCGTWFQAFLWYLTGTLEQLREGVLNKSPQCVGVSTGTLWPARFPKIQKPRTGSWCPDRIVWVLPTVCNIRRIFIIYLHAAPNFAPNINSYSSGRTTHMIVFRYNKPFKMVHLAPGVHFFDTWTHARYKGARPFSAPVGRLVNPFQTSDQRHIGPVSTWVVLKIMGPFVL